MKSFKVSINLQVQNLELWNIFLSIYTNFKLLRNTQKRERQPAKILNYVCFTNLIGSWNVSFNCRERSLRTSPLYKWNVIDWRRKTSKQFHKSIPDCSGATCKPVSTDFTLTYPGGDNPKSGMNCRSRTKPCVSLSTAAWCTCTRYYTISLYIYSL